MEWIRTAEANRYCIVSLQIGEHHANWWKLAFRRSWMAYAERHGYDLFLIDRPLEGGATTSIPEIKFEKFRLLRWPELQGYEQVLFLDADILLTDGAPCICSRVPRGKVGAVSQVRIPFRDWHDWVQPRRGEDPDIATYYRKHLAEEEWPLADGIDDILNGGLLVFDVRTHAALLDELHARHLPAARAKTGHVDQPVLSCELLRRGLAHRLDVRFNAIFSMWFALHYPFVDERDEVLMRRLVDHLTRLVHGLHFPSMRGLNFLPQRYFDQEFARKMGSNSGK